MIQSEQHVDGHADCHEEQTEQNSPERLDVSGDLMAVFGFGQQHAGEKSAESQRKASLFREVTGAKRDQQHTGNKQFRRSCTGNNTQQRAEQQPADDHDDTDCDHAFDGGQSEFSGKISVQ